MGRHLSLTLVLVADDNVIVVDGEPLVGVDSDAEETGVGVDQEDLVARPQVMHNRSLETLIVYSKTLLYLGQVGHVGHILKQLVLWRGLGFDIVGLEELDLAVDETLDLDLAVLLLAGLLTLGVASLGIRDPAGGATLERSVSKESINSSLNAKVKIHTQS